MGFLLYTGKGKDSHIITQFNNQLSPVGVTSVVSKYCSDINISSHLRMDGNSCLSYVIFLGGSVV